MKVKRAVFKKESRGTIAVEFVLVLPVLVLLVFGIIELGSAWYSKQMLVSASREGARYGSMYDEDGITDGQVEAYVVQLLNDSSFPGTASVTSTGAGGTAGAQVRVLVTSQYNFPILSNLIPGGVGSMTLSATTVMRHE